MELRKIMNEEFLTSVKGYAAKGKHIEIYVNPNESDFESVKNNTYGDNMVRFIADGKARKVFIFSIDEIHHTIMKELGIGNDYHEMLNPKKRMLTGTAIKRGNSWFMSGSDGLNSIVHAIGKEIAEQWEKDYAFMVFNENWSWVNKWINVDKEMADLKKEYNAVEGIKEMSFLSTAVKNILLKEKF